MTVCPKCKGSGWVLWVYPETKPRPAYWFSRTKGASKPVPCDCMSEKAGEG